MTRKDHRQSETAKLQSTKLANEIQTSSFDHYCRVSDRIKQLRCELKIESDEENKADTEAEICELKERKKELFNKRH